MSDAAMMSRMGRGENSKDKDHGWFVREGPVADHFRVWPLVATVLFPCMGTMLIGFDSGATAWLMVAIKLCKDDGEGHWCVLVEENVGLSGALEATTSLAAMVSCCVIFLIGGNRLGGRTELLLASMFFTIGSTVEAESADMATSAAGLYVLFTGRGVYGFGMGLCIHAIPSYISEFAPPKLRGTLGGCIEVTITIGIIYAYAIGQWLTYEFPYAYSWKYTFKFATIFSITMFFGMLYLPDSPRWLVSAGRPLYEALEAAQFVNPDMTSEGIVNLKKDIERQLPSPSPQAGHRSGSVSSDLNTGQRPSTSVMGRLCCTPSLRVPMLVGIGLVAGQQLTGLPAMLYYCVDIFREVADAQLMAAMLSFAGSKLLASVVVMLYMDSWGRRTPLIAGLLLMFVSSGCIFMFFYDSLQHDTAYQWGFVALLDLFVVGYELGIGAVTFVLLGEIFPGDIKGEALALGFITTYAIAAGLLFLVYFEVFELGYSVVWGQFSVACFVYVFFAASLVPETKGKTLEQIQREFQQEFEVPDFEEVVAYLSGGTDNEDSINPTSPTPQTAGTGTSASSSLLEPGGGGGGAGGGATANPFNTGSDLNVTSGASPLV